MLRAAVFRQLQRVAASGAPAFHAHSTQLRTGSFWAADMTASRRFFATKNDDKGRSDAGRDRGLAINGIPLKTLAATSKPALIEEFGEAKVAKTMKGLPYHLGRILESTTSRRPAVHVLKQIFSAADKCDATWIMQKALEAVEMHQPRPRFESAMYTSLYHALQRRNDHVGLLRVYDEFLVRPEFVEAPFPEIIYSFGIVGKFAASDLAAVEEIVREMRKHNVRMSGDVWSQLMIGFARAGNEDRTLKIFQFIMNDDITKLREADVNRVILALGCIGKPQLAFEFYGECQTPLNPALFDALLSVCVQNEATQEGIAILKNRKRFGLILDTAGYTRVLKALETFNVRDEIFDVLDEMKINKVRFSPTIDEVVARNQDNLVGTAFTMRRQDEADLKSAVEAGEVVTALQEAIASEDLKTATQLADSLVYIAATQRTDVDAKNLQVLGATTVLPLVATDSVVEAYARGGQHHKLMGLARGLLLSSPSGSEEELSSLATAFAHLIRIAFDAGAIDEAHALLKASLKHASRTSAMASALQPLAIEATQVMVQIGDSLSAIELVNLLLSKVNGNVESVPLHDVLHRVLGLLVRGGQLKHAFAVLGNAQNHGVELNEQLYASVASIMTKTNQTDPADMVAVTYNGDDMQNLWEDCRQRGIPVSEKLISCSSALLARGDRAQRALLWDAFLQLTTNNGEIALRSQVFQDLLEVAAKDHTSVEALFVYDTAVSTLARSNNLPSEMLKSLVDKLASEDQVDEAFARLESSPVKPSNGALAVTLRSIVEANCSDSRALYLLQQMRQLHKRGLGLPMASTLLEVASQQRGGLAPAELAWALVESFEFRKIASDTMDLKSWKSVFHTRRNLENGLVFYAMAHDACKDVADFDDALQHRRDQLEEIKHQWEVHLGTKPNMVEEDAMEA